MVEVNADKIFADLPGRMACTASYGGTSLSPAAKGTMSLEWQTETYGEGSSYQFSVWTTAAAGGNLGIKNGRALTVDGTDYKVMGIDKTNDVLWRIDVENIYG